MDDYHLSCKGKPVSAPAKKAPEPKKPEPKGKKGKKKRSRKPSGPAPKLIWSENKSLIVRAMVVADDKLIVAGPPDLGKKDSKVLQFTNEKEALAGFTGEKGVFLRVISAADGKKVSEVKLDTMPVFDGMSAANGNLFISLKNGTLECRGN